MFLSDAAQDAIRTAEITATNAAAAPVDTQATFRTTEIVAQNAAEQPSSDRQRMLMVGVGVLFLYYILKGRT